MNQQILIGLIPFLFILPLIAFWLWMFQDMLNNNDMPRDAKDYWTWAFVLLNVFAATIYYANIYRFRR